MKATMNEMVAAVKAHALERYENGWDIVVEAMTDEEIADRIKRCTTTKGAIKKLATEVQIHSERRQEVEAEIF